MLATLASALLTNATSTCTSHQPLNTREKESEGWTNVERGIISFPSCVIQPPQLLRTQIEVRDEVRFSLARCVGRESVGGSFSRQVILDCISSAITSFQCLFGGRG
jgi:hypothetical protein